MLRQLFVSKDLDEQLSMKLQKELKLGYINLQDQMWEQAKLCFNLILQADEKCADAYWGIMLANLELSNENDLSSDPLKFKDVLQMPELRKALQNANQSQTKIYTDILENIIKINVGDNY